jgi:putative hydrolase of the HAD superfamily
MKKKNSITHLFLDIGEVLLTNGWDRRSRKLAAENFHLEFEELESRHHLNFGIMEEGKLTLEEYLNRIVFYKDRQFASADFCNFIFSQSKPYPQMINFLFEIKEKYGLKVAAVSNESREINAYRIQTFKLDLLIDFFISSCYVKLRKPDIEIYRLALDISQAKAEQVVYIENTAMFVNIAKKLGICGILHKNYETTSLHLEEFGLGDR